MHVANSRATTKKSKKRSITAVLRKERKWNHIKCSVKTTKGRKRVENKQKKEQGPRATNNKL